MVSAGGRCVLEPVGIEAVVLGGDAGGVADDLDGDGGRAAFADPEGEAEGEEEVVVVVAGLGAVAVVDGVAVGVDGGEGRDLGPAQGVSGRGRAPLVARAVGCAEVRSALCSRPGAREASAGHREEFADREYIDADGAVRAARG